jgi:DNA-binding CsgD family transcriptional regulator
MSEGPFGLTTKECEALRLLSQGHDVKSAAAALDVSIHTVNERLREARRKTNTSSSRGAARLLADREGPSFSGPQKSGVTRRHITDEQSARLHLGPAEGSRLLSRWGVPMMISAAVAATILAGAHVMSNTPAAPRVVSTFPTLNAVVDAGPINLSVTFDRPMRKQSYSFVQTSEETYPHCGRNQPTQSADGRTFTLKCEVQARHHYEIWFNRPPYMNFVDENGAPAMPLGLRFRTR